MFAIGALLYGAAHEMLPWQKWHALKQRAETAESERDEARRELAAAARHAAARGPGPPPLHALYRQREPYRQPDEHTVQIVHRVGIQNPVSSPL